MFQNRKKFSIVSFQLMYTYRTLCAVLTARGSDIMKITVLKTLDLYVRTVERMNTLITLVNVKTLQNVLAAAKGIRRNLTPVKLG